MAIVSFRRVRGLMAFFPFLKCLIAHLATLDCRERRLVENCFAFARISSRNLASTTLSYPGNVSCLGSRAPASAIMDRSGPLPQRVEASLPMKWNSPAKICLRTSRPIVLLVHGLPLGVQNLDSALDRT